MIVPRALKRFSYAILSLMLLSCALPALALESDTQPPVISFLTDDYFRGYPVIYARDIEGEGISPGFTGFMVSDDTTQYFADVSFREGRLLPGQGMVRVEYDRDALNGFTSKGEGEVSIVAIDAAGNTAALKAWCIVKPTEAPYYADMPRNEPNENENRTSVSIPAKLPYAFYREEFITDRLISGSETVALHIDSLPDNGKLSVYSLGEFIDVVDSDLPLRVSMWDIHAGKLLYTPQKVGRDCFLFRLEDMAGNIASISSAMDITVQKGPVFIGDVEDMELDSNAKPFTFDIQIDLSYAQAHASSIDVDISPIEKEVRNADISVGFLRDDTWRVSVSPVPNMTGECEYIITAKNGEEVAISTFKLNLKSPDESVAAADDAIEDFIGTNTEQDDAPPIRMTELTIGVPGADEWARSAKLSIAVDNHEYVSKVELLYANGPYSGCVAYVLEGGADGVFTGEVYAAGRYMLKATDVFGESITREFQVKNVNSAPPVIAFDRTQLKYGAFDTTYLSVKISCATDIADVRILSDNMPIEGAVAELAAQGEYRLNFEELHDTEVIIEATDAQGLVATLNLGRLTRDTSPPVFEVDYPNEENAYYLPRLVRVSDESRIESVTRIEEVDYGVYRIPMSIGAAAEEEVTATDSFGNTSKIKLTMLMIPDPSRLTLLEKSEEVKATVSAIIAELEMMGDNASLTQAERRKLVEIIGALSWEADALAFIQAEETLEHMVAAHSLYAAMPGIPMISEDIADEFLLRYTINIASERIENSLNNMQGAVDAELMRVLEDAVIQSFISFGDESGTEETRRLMNIYENLTNQIGVHTKNDVAFLVGMLSRVDYTPAREYIGDFETYFTTEQTDQLSGMPPEEDSFFIGAVDLRIMAGSRIEPPNDLLFFPGKQGLLCIRAALDDTLYDISTLRMMRVSEEESVELEILRTQITDSGIFLFIPISDTGRLELYAKMAHGQAEQAPADEPEQVPEQAQEDGPEPEPTPEPTPEPIPEPTPNTAKNESNAQSIAPEPMQDALNQSGNDGEEAQEAERGSEVVTPEQEMSDISVEQEASDISIEQEAPKVPGLGQIREALRNDDGRFASQLVLIIIAAGTLLIVLIRVLVALKRLVSDDTSADD